MVEKVSEVSIKTAVNIDSSSDDRSLLEWIDKKKRQQRVGEHSQPGMTLSPEMLIRLINTPTAAAAAKGGLQKTEQQPTKQGIPAAFGNGANSLPAEKGDGLRRRAILPAAVPQASGADQPKPAAAQAETVGVGNRKSVATVSKTEPLPAAVPQASGADQPKPAAAQAETVGVGNRKSVATVSKTEPLPAVISAAKNQPRTTAAQPVPIGPVTRPVSDPQPAMTERRQQRKEEAGEVRPIIQNGKLHEFSPPQQSEIRTQNKNVPMTLQQLKAQAGAGVPTVKPDAESQTLEVEYTFQRWSGDHSVRVSVPTQALREGNITLLPSDPRAADMLSRNMGHLTGLTPELLQPQRDRDEQQQRRQQPQQDEDQE